MVPIRTPLGRITIRRGAVFKLRHRALTSPLPHFLIVLNRNPFPDKVIILSAITSNIQVRRARAENLGQPPQTVVELAPSDYPPLDHPSCVDCNDVEVWASDEFEKIVCANPSASYQDIDSAVVDRIVAGVLASSRVRDEYKTLIRPADSSGVLS